MGESARGENMKILAINGSHRGENGYTHFLIGKLFSGIEAAGAKCEEVVLAKLEINRCISCGKCNAKDHFLKCVFDDKDDVREVFNKMAAADILVFATPIYIFNMTALLKTFLDRLYATADVFDLKLSQSGLFFHHLDHDICSKPFVTLICCDNPEKETPKTVISYFRTYSKFHDALQVGLLVRNAGRFATHGKDPEAEKRAPKLAEVYRAYEQAGKELVAFGRIQSSTQRTANQNILPIPPAYKILKRLRPFKEKMVAQARLMSQYSEGDV
jgi:multimeric flavodoxin WrbA